MTFKLASAALGLLLLAIGCTGRPTPSVARAYTQRSIPQGTQLNPMPAPFTGAAVDAVTTHPTLLSPDQDLMAQDCGYYGDRRQDMATFVDQSDNARDSLMIVDKNEHVREAKTPLLDGMGSILNNVAFINTDNGYAGWICAADVKPSANNDNGG